MFRNVFNSVHDKGGDEGKAMAAAHSKAKECEGNKAMKDFTIFAPLLKTAESDGKRRLHGTASSTVKDRHGDVITLDALRKMEASAQGMTIFLNHEYRVPEDVAGTVEKAVVRSHPSDPDIHDLVFDIVLNEANPRATSAWEAIQGGTQLGLSIGAKIPDGGASRDAEGTFTINDIMLLETSLVGVPASPRSWVEYAVKSLRSQMIDKATAIRATGVDLEEPEDAEADDAVVENATAMELATEDEPAVEVVPQDPAPEGQDQSSPDEEAEPEAEPPEDMTFLDSETPDEPDPAPQDASESNPENGDLVQSEDTEITLTALLTSADSLTAAHTVIENLNRELGITKAALNAAVDERDQVVAASQKTMNATASLLERLQETSRGRQTHPVLVETAKEFGDLRAVYTKDVMALLTKEQH